MKTFKLAEQEFNDMMSVNNYEVRITGFSEGPIGKLKFKAGYKKVVTYRDGLDSKGVMQKNWEVDSITQEDVFREKDIKSRVVSFEFLNEEDQKTFELRNQEP